MDADRLNSDPTEALARGREPRTLWPVLHYVDDLTKTDLPQMAPVLGWVAVVMLLLGALAKC